MTRDDIIKMAMDADGHINSHARGIDMDWDGIVRLAQTAYAAGAAAEREACAKLCEDAAKQFGLEASCAAAIRARGQT